MPDHVLSVRQLCFKPLGEAGDGCSKAPDPLKLSSPSSTI